MHEYSPDDSPVVLAPFEREDIPDLIRWVPDARFLMQWSGTSFSWPLDRKQMEHYQQRGLNEPGKTFNFTARTVEDGRRIGHVSLANVEASRQKTGRLCRVLIGPGEARNRGLGQAMVEAVVDFGMDELGLESIDLVVYDFNKSAIRCYEKVGFKRHRFLPKARRFQDEKWNILIMQIGRKDWPQARSGES